MFIELKLLRLPSQGPEIIYTYYLILIFIDFMTCLWLNNLILIIIESAPPKDRFMTQKHS